MMATNSTIENNIRPMSNVLVDFIVNVREKKWYSYASTKSVGETMADSILQLYLYSRESAKKTLVMSIQTLHNPK